MSGTPVTPDFVAVISGMSARTVERLINSKKLPKPSSKYRREWIGPTTLTALADALAKRPEPSARHASAIIEKIRGPVPKTECARND
jgi:hypothetical protein